MVCLVLPSTCLSVRDTPHWKLRLPNPLRGQFQNFASYLSLHLRKLTNHPNMTGFMETYLDISSALAFLALNKVPKALMSDFHILL